LAATTCGGLILFFFTIFDIKYKKYIISKSYSINKKRGGDNG